MHHTRPEHLPLSYSMKPADPSDGPFPGGGPRHRAPGAPGEARQWLPRLRYMPISVACTAVFATCALLSYLLQPLAARCAVAAAANSTASRDEFLLTPPADDSSARPPPPPLPPPPPPPPPPPFALPSNFDPARKYLYYGRTGDFCAGVRHFTWSLQCALAEAHFLGRTFAVDAQKCVPRQHNGGRHIVADLRYYYDLGPVHEEVPLMSLQALQQLKPWASEDSGVSYRVVPPDTLSRKLLQETATVLHRNMTGRYAFDVCLALKNRKHLRPMVDKLEQPLYRGGPIGPPWRHIVRNILEVLSPSFVGVHVRRGDKASRVSGWPHLDNDTRPERLLRKLPKLVPNATVLYIATDELAPHFFEPLKERYVVFLLSDFRAFWGPTSDWAEACRRLSPVVPEFDGIMQGMVDYSILAAAKTTIETFNQLTSDDRHGLPAPRKAPAAGPSKAPIPALNLKP